MIETIILAAAFVFLAIASYKDIRTNEIPDWINFAALSTAFGLRVLYSAFIWDYQPILSGILGFAVFYAIGYIMFYTGQWGGGDSKLLMATGAFLGLEFNMQAMALSFLVALIITGAIYGTIWSAVLALKNRKAFLKNMKKILFSTNFRLANRISLITPIIILVLAIVAREDRALFTILMFIAVAAPFFFYLFVLVKAVENCCMIKKVEPEKLAEGDWIAKDIIVNGKKICGPKDLGISKAQIKILMQLKKQHKIQKVVSKTGIPFTPSFLLAFMLMIKYGNILAMLIK